MSLLVDRPLQRAHVQGGVEIHYAEAGSGAPLVFVHGGMGDWTSWAPQWPAFTPHFRCISYSRRYSSPNRNALTSDSHSVIDEAQDLVELLAQWSDEPAILVGTSYGAYTALQAALVAPDRVRALAITEPPVLPFADEVPGGRAARLQFEREVLQPATEAYAMGDDGRAVRQLTQGINGANSGEAATPEGRARRMRNSDAMRALCLSSNAYPALEHAALSALKLPILLTHGAHTQAVHRATTQALARHLHQAHVVQVADSGHGVHRDNPEVFNAQVLRFLQDAMLVAA